MSVTVAERLRPGVFLRTGHRGARGLAPENTMAGFRRAAEVGVDVLELDVRLTRDGEVVVMHDATVDRTTDWAGPGPGVVAELTYAQLTELDAGHRFSPDGGETFPFRGQGLRVPRLVEVLEAFPGHLITIELKRGTPPAVVDRTVALAREVAPQRVIMASEDHALLQAARRAAPELASSFSGREVRDFYLLSRACLATLFFRSRGRVLQMPLWSDHDRDRGLRLVHPGLLVAAHARGLLVHVWTINDPAVMRELIDLGVDGITTDRPDLLAGVLGWPAP